MTTEFKTLREAITKPHVIGYIERRVKSGANVAHVAERDVEDITQDILVKLWALDRPLDSNGNWEAFFFEIVKNHLIDRHRANKDLPIGADVDKIERPRPKSAGALPDDFGDYGNAIPPDGATMTKRFKYLFEAILDTCNPIDFAMLPILESPTRPSPKRRSVWRILRNEYPTPSNREIARRVGTTHRTVAGAKKALAAEENDILKAENDFFERAASDYNTLDSRQKLGYLRSIVIQFTGCVLEDIRKVRRNVDRVEWRRLCGQSKNCSSGRSGNHAVMTILRRTVQLMDTGIDFILATQQAKKENDERVQRLSR